MEFADPAFPRGSLTRGDQGGALLVVEEEDLHLAGVASTVLKSQLKTSEWATFTTTSHFEELIHDTFLMLDPLVLDHMAAHENSTMLADFTETARLALVQIEKKPWKTLVKKLKKEAQTQFLKGRNLLDTAFNRSDKLEALALIKEAALQQHPIALFEMATQYFDGKFIPQDLFKARSSLEASADLNYIPAFSTLAYMCRKGEGGPKDIKRANALLHHAATVGYPHAQHQLALMYFQGEGYKEDRDEAIAWLQKAAAQAYPASMAMLEQLTQTEEQDWQHNHMRMKANGTVAGLPKRTM